MELGYKEVTKHMTKFFKALIIYILTLESRIILAKHKPFLILVAGSVGKTTTKDAIFHVLKDTTKVRKSEKSYNSELGVPLTILGLPNAWRNPLLWLSNVWKGLQLALKKSEYPKVLILELGSDHPGDIRRLVKWLRPDIAVLTTLPEIPVHVEFFGSPEAIRSEDALVFSMVSKDSVCVVNADDPHALLAAEHLSSRTISYGFGAKSDMVGSGAKIRYAMNEGQHSPVGMEFTVTWEKEKYSVHLKGALGVGHCSALLAALAVGVARGESMARMCESLSTFAPPRGRMCVLDGKSGSIILDDSYNSSPIAIEIALDTLRSLEGKRKIAMLGDMLELGKYSDEEHWKAGRRAGGFVDELITVGKEARLVAEAAKSAGLPEGRIHICATSEDAGKLGLEMIRPGDIFLFKGSQGSGKNMIRMERAVKMMMAHPDDAAKLLVRQEKEWLEQYE